MRGRRQSQWMCVAPVDLALAILGEPWDSTEALERAIRDYAWTHFHESLVVRRRSFLSFRARFAALRYSSGPTAAVAMARAFVRRWVEYRLAQEPIGGSASTTHRPTSPPS